MLNRPAVPREKRVERQSATNATELDKGLEAAIRRSTEAIRTKIDGLIKNRYSHLEQDKTDQNA